MSKKKILFINECFKTWEKTMSRASLFKNLENKFEKFFTKDEEGGRKILESASIDFICMNYNPWGKISALDIVKNLRKSGCNIPVCVFFSYDDEEECKEAGASITITTQRENGIYGAIVKLLEDLVENQ